MRTLDKTILYIVGGDGGDRAAQAAQAGKVVARASDLRKLVDDPSEILPVSRNFFRHPNELTIGHFRVLVNLITEPEESRRELENVRKLLRGVRSRVINPPDAVLRTTRDRVARLLTGIPDLIVPKAVRFSAAKPAIAERMIRSAGIEPPIILREAGTHGGKIVGCFDSVEATVAALQGGRDHVATQFVDFSSADNLYRKYRVYFIGKGKVLRHMLISDHWNVHAKDRLRFMAERPELVAEERALFESDDYPLPFSPKVRAALHRVAERMGMDFFGMDFGVTRDEQVVLFEANATMRFFPYSPEPMFEYSLRSFAPAQAAFRDMLGLEPQPATLPYEIKLQSA